MINPNYIYSFIFLVVFGIYQLEWSDLYPALRLPLLLFLIFTISANFMMGSFLKRTVLKTKRVPEKTSNEMGIILGTLLLSIIWTIDKSLGNIPTVHIILVTFTSFYNCFVFSKFLQEKKAIQFFIFVILFLTTAILSTFRILIFFNLVTCLLTYVYLKNPFKTTNGKLIIMVLATGLLFVFGSLGNTIKGHDTGKVILVIGEATEEFKNSIFPDEFFWTYLYSSSPLANLQLNIEYHHSIEPTLHGYWLWMISEFLPDFISKNIFASINEKQLIGIQVNPALNVSTVYLRSFRYASWFGLTFMAFFVMIFPMIYLYIIRNSKYFITGLVSVTTIYMFLIFDNIFAFSPLSFQLVYPLFGIWKIKLKSTDE